jgi:hypothetical protein
MWGLAMDGDGFSATLPAISMKTDSCSAPEVSSSRTTLRPCGLLALAVAALLLGGAGSATAASLLDVWRADDLNLNDGDAVTTWNSASNRSATAVFGETPSLRFNGTPGGTRVVRFSGSHRLSVANSPAGGRTSFSVAVVFKATGVGANNSAQWWGKTGLVDAEEPGVVSDWGTVITETGAVGVGTGNPDNTTYSPGASLVDGNFHVAVFTWGSGSQSVYLNDRAAMTQGGVSTAARNGAGISIGGIRTGEANRRFIGDIAEIRFYDAALSGVEATNVISQLRDTYILGNLPRVVSFQSSTNQIYLGGSATLSWNVTNANTVQIDGGIGLVPASGSTTVSPTTTTTYTLGATNANGGRTATVTVQVDPGVPNATGFTTNTTRNTPLSLLLRGSDPNGGTLTYAIVTPPQHGSLSGTPPNVQYTPANAYEGSDAFTFKVNDGSFDSAPATVSIQVIPPPTAPSGIVLSSTNISSAARPGSFVAALRANDVNTPQGDTHTFALVPGFGDNAQFVVNGAILNAGPLFAGGVGSTFNIRLRATDSANLTVEQNFVLTVVDAPQQVVINEVHYNGERNVIRDSFIEIHNPTDSTVDLSQWSLRGAVDFFFPANTFLPPDGFLVVAEDPAVIQSRFGVTAFGPWNGGLNNEGEEISLRDALNDEVDVVDYESEFPWPIAANGDGPSMQLVNPALDNTLGSSWRSGRPPTPGQANSVLATNAAPNIRQVVHSPETPSSTNSVVITAKVTDPEGVASVTLAYQVVAPGAFIPARLPLTTTQINSLNSNPALTNALNPAFEAATNWTVVTMRDDGLNGDVVAGDNIYTAVLPPQANRTLVRYRITCTDSLGLSRRAPFEDDPSLNFAYFVYDGVPNYLHFSSASLQTLPVYSLITRDADILQCTAWFNAADQLPQDVGGQRNEGRLYFNWEGALVYDGKVYDHVRYRLRGANGRYHPGKRSFRIRFNEGRLLEAKDQYGNRFPTKWRELTTGKGQSNRGGEQFALNEVVNYFLWNKVGVPAPRTFHFHFRVIRGAQESPTDQYAGDFWGLNWAQEKYDVNFLESHDLPRGNLYKLVDNYFLGVEERRYQAPYAVTNAEDFFNIENNLSGFQSMEWLNAHANYTNWYRYFTIAEAIRHYDIWPSANKNGAWYFEPLYGASNNFYGRIMQLPYDGTDTWGPTWNNGEDLLFNGIFPSTAPGGDSGQHPEMQKEYRNTVREIRALLFQPDQINAIIDAHAYPLYPVAAADHARWSNAPAPASYRSLIIANSPGVTGGLPAYQQDMKNFMFVGGNNPWWLDRQSIGAGGWVTRLDTIAADAAIPNRPTATYAGTNGYPVDGLVFQSSAFADPQGAGTFAAMQWRIAEVLPPGTIVSNRLQLKLEWDAAWTSPEITSFNEFITIPDFAVQADRLYRVRVRHKDNTGRWSQWSLPVEFRPSPRDVIAEIRGNLVFNEIMYNAPAQGSTSGDDLEFLELKNIGPATLDLSGLFFSQGITFTFTNGTMLAPGATFLLARNAAALTTHYPGAVVRGTYSGRLANEGETIAISHPSAAEVLSLTYGERAPWPVAADGFGFSIVRDASGGYGASAQRFGNPGVDGGATAIGGVVINEILSSSSSPLSDAIELHNTTGTNIDVGGWYLSDSPTLPQKFRIAAPSIIPPGGYVVFDESHFNPTPGVGVSFSLSSFGDDVYLFSASANGKLTGYSHGFSFGAAADGVSFGRYINSAGEEDLVLMSTRTLGAANSAPRVGPVVMSEVHYNPASGDTNEFVELRNITGSPVALFDAAFPTNRWQVSGIGFTFPANVTIPANGLVLLISGDTNAFRARHGIDAAVQIFSYPGSLQDSGERVELLAPDAPTTNGVPYYATDAVRYNDRKPWPLAADGAGASLHRLVPSTYGNDPTNWFGAAPSPGNIGTSGTAPVFTMHPTNQSTAVGNTVTFNATASGSPTVSYQWRFNGGNLTGATNATLVLSSVDVTNSGTYQVVAFNAAGSVDSSNAQLVVRFGPTITNHPVSVNVRIRPDPNSAPSTNATFTVGAVSYNPPVRYQWQFNGTNIAGATNVSLTITNVQLTHEGAYRVVVTDTVGPVTSASAQLSPWISPTLVLAPGNMSVVTGALVHLSVVATGNPLPFGFQWLRSGATFASNTFNERTNYFSFLNTNAVGSTINYRAVVRSASGSVQQNFSITTLADSDADGLPDVWESQFGLDSGNATDRLLDADSDGFANWQEYAAGTDPTNSADALRLSATVSNGTASVGFQAISNRTYSVQFRENLAEGSWLKLADIPARTNSFPVQFEEPANTNRFYRLVTPRQP